MARDLVPRATIARRRDRVVGIVRALPGTEVEGERHLGFSVRGRRFGWYVDDHHGDGRTALHLKAEPGTNSALAEVHPDRFHVPAYLGSRGWLGLWLDLPAIDWDEVAALLREAYESVAPERRAAVTGKPGRRTPRRPRRRTRRGG